MVRRLKADLRRLGEAFPERIVEPVRLAGLPGDTPELKLAELLAAYGDLRTKRISRLPSQRASLAKLAFVGLQQRLLSSVAAFAKTIKVHRTTLQRVLDGEVAAGVATAAQSFVDGPVGEENTELGLEDEVAESAMDADDDAMTEAASAVGVNGAATADLRTELAAADEMLELAQRYASQPDARVHWLVAWIKENMLSGTEWLPKRLIVFTEYEDTRRWLERRLREALAETDRAARPHRSIHRSDRR